MKTKLIKKPDNFYIIRFPVYFNKVLPFGKDLEWD